MSFRFKPDGCLVGAFLSRLRVLLAAIFSMFALTNFTANNVLAASTAASDGAICQHLRPGLAETISACTRLIEVGVDDKNLADMYLNRGNAHFQMGDYGSAISDYNEAINRRPYFVAAYQNRGLAQFRLKNLDSALANFKSAIKLDDSVAQLYSLRGSVMNETGEFDQAIQEFREALLLDPKLVQAYVNRGFSYAQKRLTDKAISDYTGQLKLAPIARALTLAERLCC